MLSIYLGDIYDNMIRGNDGWFDTHLESINFDDEYIQKVMLELDGARRITKNKIETKFLKDCASPITVLSTGCKTIINVYSFPDKIFTALECGDSALEYLFNLNTGNIQLGYVVLVPHIAQPVRLVINDNSEVIQDRATLSRKINKYFREGVE